LESQGPSVADQHDRHKTSEDNRATGKVQSVFRSVGGCDVETSETQQKAGTVFTLF
jgi:hypothetical protein